LLAKISEIIGVVVLCVWSCKEVEDENDDEDEDDEEAEDY
jgi:hypothetical protein